MSGARCNQCGVPIIVVRIVGKSKSIALNEAVSDNAAGNYAVHFGQAEKIVAGQAFTGEPHEPHKPNCPGRKRRR